MPRADMQIQLRMVGCRTLQKADDVVSIARDLPRYGLLPIRGRGPNITPVDDIPAFVHAQSGVFRHGLMGNWFVVFSVMPQGKRHIICTFDCGDTPERVSYCNLGSLIDRKDSDEVEPFAEVLLSLAFDYYSRLSPSIGYIDEVFANETSAVQVKRTRIVSIGWANFFGPPYVQKYGREFFVHLPGHRTEELPDGGVFHQLTRTFLSGNQKAAKVLRQEVVDYCRQAGLKVTCHAPYFFPASKPSQQPVSVEEGMTDTEVQEYIQQILATTLILEDDIRVKVVFVPWKTLTARQQSIVIEAIRQATVEEIKGRRGQRIRFEFNEIPDDLERVLVDLVGRNNLAFEFVQVDMQAELRPG